MNLFAQIISFGSITSQRIISPRNIQKRDNEELAQFSREAVFSQPNRSFGKLSPVDKLTFGAAALALESTEEYDAQTLGIVLSSSQGSLTRDKAYMQTVNEGFPSPAFFSSTLPSSPIAEIAILFGIKGPNRVVNAPINRELFALENALLMLQKNEVILLVSVDESPQGSATALLLKNSQEHNAHITLTSSPFAKQTNTPLLSNLIDHWRGRKDFITTDSNGTPIVTVTQE